jgi:hypothetical protein
MPGTRDNCWHFGHSMSQQSFRHIVDKSGRWSQLSFGTTGSPSNVIFEMEPPLNKFGEIHSVSFHLKLMIEIAVTLHNAVTRKNC